MLRSQSFRRSFRMVRAALEGNTDSTSIKTALNQREREIGICAQYVSSRCVRSARRTRVLYALLDESDCFFSRMQRELVA